MPAFRHTETVRLRDTDAAGVIYFAHQLHLAHTAYEAWLASEGLDFGALIGSPQVGLPIVHAEIDLTAPVRVGDVLHIELSVARHSRRSFTLEYRFERQDGVRVGRAMTVHVAADKALGKSTELPAPVLRLLESRS